VIRLILAMPPSANDYWRYDRGRAHLTHVARRYKRDIGSDLLKAGVTPLPKGVTVGVRMTVYRPRKSGDLDNRFKVVLDALNKVAWQDDSQVVEIHGYRRDDKKNPRVEVAVWVVGEPSVQGSLKL
jgi:crossover junction endodeoxyribonuclease RusA